MSTRILVTGGAGYIGSHAAKELSAADFDVVVYDNLIHGHRWAARWGRLIEGDLADGNLLRDVLRTEAIGAVMHFAAFINVGESTQQPAKYYRNNVANSLNLLEAMRDTGISRLIFSSTCAIYGNPLKLPLSEDHPHNPENPYGETKLAVEKMIRDFGKGYGLTSMSLRYFNASGADLSGEIGEDHDPETHLIPLILFTQLGKLDRLVLNGTDYPTPDGTAIRDYVHVTDLARAHVQALRYLLDGGSSDTVNIGSGCGHSIREVIRCAEKVTGQTIPVIEAARRQGDAVTLVADASKARRLLSWHAEMSDLETILSTAYRWHRKHHG